MLSGTALARKSSTNDLGLERIWAPHQASPAVYALPRTALLALCCRSSGKAFARLLQLSNKNSCIR